MPQPPGGNLTRMAVDLHARQGPGRLGCWWFVQAEPDAPCTEAPLFADLRGLAATV